MVLAVSCREEETKPISLGICGRMSLHTHVSVQFTCSDISETDWMRLGDARAFLCVCARSHVRACVRCSHFALGESRLQTGEEPKHCCDFNRTDGGLQNIRATPWARRSAESRCWWRWWWCLWSYEESLYVAYVLMRDRLWSYEGLIRHG